MGQLREQRVGERAARPRNDLQFGQRGNGLPLVNPEFGDPFGGRCPVGQRGRRGPFPRRGQGLDPARERRPIKGGGGSVHHHVGL